MSQFISCVFAHLEWLGRFTDYVSSLPHSYLQRTRENVRLLLLRLLRGVLLLPRLSALALGRLLGQRGEVGGRRVADVGRPVLRLRERGSLTG